MQSIELTGKCRCANISYKSILHSPLDKLVPRRCTCDFCQSHKAIYLSDPNGSLSIYYRDAAAIKIHTQGSGLAKFVLCNQCDSFVCVYFESENIIYASINIDLCIDVPSFADAVSISPNNLPAKEKVGRWKSLWFKNVNIKMY